MAPTLVPTVQSAFARVQLTLTWPGIKTAIVQRLDPDGVLRNVRSINGDDAQVCLGSCAFFDHEAPLDAAVTYRATSPQGTGTVVSDAFGRTVANGWGNADTGQAWTTNGGTAANYSVGSGVGSISNASLNVNRFVTAGSSQNFDMVCLVTIPVVATGGSIIATLAGRFVNASNQYLFGLNLNPAGVADVKIWKNVAGVITEVSASNGAFTYTAGASIWIRAQASGSTLRCKAWLSTLAEPAFWTVTGTDVTFAAAGPVGVMNLFTGSNTNTLPVAITHDSLTVNDLAPLTVTSGAVTVTSGGRVWLKDPGRPAANRQVRIAEVGNRILGSRRGVFRPIGDDVPIVVSDLRQSDTGSIALMTDGTWADLAAYRTQFAPGSGLLLQYPSGYGGESLWISPGDLTLDPTGRKATSLRRVLRFPFEVIDRPAGATLGAAGQTWNDVKATYATWTAVIAAKATWTALNQSVT